MKKDGLWLCNLFVKVLDKQVCNIRLYEVVIKLTIICFENNIKCSLNVNKRIPIYGIKQCCQAPTPSGQREGARHGTDSLTCFSNIDGPISYI